MCSQCQQTDKLHAIDGVLKTVGSIMQDYCGRVRRLEHDKHLASAIRRRLLASIKRPGWKR